jgi:Raf kinase inhibitor-like YbhB/YbcL family protein
MSFQLTSPAFAADGEIPRKYSCDAEDVSPALEWADAPDDAAALALIVDDPDARGFVHWVVFDIDATQSGGLPEGFSSSPDAPPQGTNDFRRLGWGGPWSAAGPPHHRFTLFALNAPLELAGAPKADEIRAAMEGHVIDQAELVASYKRQR